MVLDCASLQSGSFAGSRHARLTIRSTSLEFHHLGVHVYRRAEMIEGKRGSLSRSLAWHAIDREMTRDDRKDKMVSRQWGTPGLVSVVVFLDGSVPPNMRPNEREDNSADTPVKTHSQHLTLSCHYLHGPRRAQGTRGGLWEFGHNKTPPVNAPSALLECLQLVRLV